MIRPTEALLLARTKLKTRRVRLWVTVIITSLLFSVLAFLAALTQGVTSSLTAFGQEGYGKRYLVQATPLSYNNDPSGDAELKTALAAPQKALIAKKKAEAKRLGIDYDERSDQQLPILAAPINQGINDTYVNYSSPLVTAEVAKRNAAIPNSDFAAFTAYARAAGATNTYRGLVGGSSYGGNDGDIAGSHISIVLNNKENLSAYTSANNMPSSFTGVDSLLTAGWRSIDKPLLQPFVLSGQTLDMGKDGSIPVVVPFSAAEEALGLKALPPTATAAQKLERLSQVRHKVTAKTVTLCYRNGISANLLSQALAQQKEIEDNKKKADYVKPSLLYQIPSTACGAVTVKSDGRTTDEKKQAAAQKLFDQTFGVPTDPEQGVVNVRIVGVNPDLTYGPSLSLASTAGSLLTSTAGQGWISPTDATATNPLAVKIQGGTVETASRSQISYYAEFSTGRQLDAFIKQWDCASVGQIQTPGGAVAVITSNDPNASITKCIAANRPFNITPYGNSAVAVDSFRNGAWRVARIALIIIITIAALIMMGTIGKIIADSRRETAVFRATGAKRVDITQIYLSYAVLICLMVAVTALCLGSLSAYLLSRHFSPDLSVAAVLAYNASNVHKKFVLFGAQPLYMLGITGLIILTGLSSALIPLLTNLRRNPIRDMRDEN